MLGEITHPPLWYEWCTS